ncbi:MAG: DoxX family protein [Winogradskyella sp.]|uniref:DoxX family protein n=1 Tax=Winogradskyella sp. TaxID=1883156 RepID=UPI000F3BD457|nr:DoxX family protein [Winogradskyella sp.]RNC87193.1 MAG: DoxX family protein [Winogradskyella sp.]
MIRLKQLLKFIIKPATQKNWFADFTFFVIRFLCGIALSLSFGADKFGVPWTADSQHLDLFEVAAWFPEDVKAYGGIFAMFPIFFAWMGAFSEAVGGMLLALGIGTRIWSFLIMCTMLVAIFLQKWNQGLWGMLPALSFLWVAMYNLTLGSGRFGLDFLISKKLK